VKLRDYQRDSLDAVHAGFAEGYKALLLVSPTGTGKSVIFAVLAREFALGEGECALLVSNRKELVEQGASAFRKMMPGVIVGIERGSQTASPFDRVISASIGSLQGPRLERFMQRFAGRVKLLIIDEAHRATAPTYLGLISRMMQQRDDLKILGVTATPRRADNVGLGKIFEKIAYSWTLRQAIERGYLVPIRGYRVDTGTSLDGVGTRNGDFAENELAAAIDSDERNALIVDAYRRVAPGRRAIVFAVSVDHSERIAKAFLAANIPAEAASGSMSERQREATVARFRSGETTVLVNCSLFLEGFDVPETEVVIQARPTKSGVLFSQATGRGTRPHPSVASLLGDASSDTARCELIARSAKPACAVIDLVDASMRHSLITLPTLFGLPPKLNPQGRSLVSVAKKYEELSLHDPLAAATAETLLGIEAKLSEVDMFAVRQMPHDIEHFAHLEWHEPRPGLYRITVPKQTWAQRKDGGRIDDYDFKRAREVDVVRAEQRAGREQSGNPLRIAERRLGVVAGTRKELTAALEVRENAIGAYDCVRIENGIEHLLGARTDLASAIGDSEMHIRKRYPSAMQLLQVDAAWLMTPVSARQTKRLREMGCPEARIPQTKGEAQRLITQLMNESAKARADQAKAQKSA